jgi:secondary thiamine-phosphate synthase enzyme
MAWVHTQEIQTGLLTIFCRHSSASLTIQENADPDGLHDLKIFFENIAPEETSRYSHGTEGPDDMPAHIRSALTDKYSSSAQAPCAWNVARHLFI